MHWERTSYQIKINGTVKNAVIDVERILMEKMKVLEFRTYI